MKTDTKRAKTVEFPHVLGAERYISGVISGKIPACKWVKLACERHLRDVASSITKEFPYVFDPAKANRVCNFLEKLRHVKGEWRGKPFILEDWQRFVVCMIFGWVKKSDGMRRFRKARIYVPRKNGKTFLVSGIGLAMLALDGEPGAEVYAGATSEKQADEVFKPARLMCLADPNLTSYFGIQVNAQTLTRDDGSKFERVIGKPGDGASPHLSITDEYHEHKTSDLIDTMETGMGARRQPISFVISTAGSNIAGPCRDDWKNCEKILENIDGFQDDTTFCIIFGLDADDRWDTEEALIKANPNFGVSINRDHMLASLRTAQQRANQQSAYQTKHLNRWVSAKEAFFNTVEWAALAKPEIKREDYKEFPSYLAGDLASKHDLVCLMQLFCLPDKRYAVFGRYWLPQAALDMPENQHYRNWHIGGWLEVAGDDVTDLETFKEDSIEFCREYQVEEFPFDPNRAWGVFPALEREGLPVVEYRNTVLTMSEPMKELDALIRSGRIIHNGDPILEWAIGNVTGKYDKKDNVFPNKEAPQNKIDPVVSLMFALGRAMTRDDGVAGPLIVW